MKTTPLILPLLLCGLLSVAPATAQSGASTEDLAELERRAEQSFVADELETAITLYRQLAGRLTVKEEKLRILMTVASVQHLAGRDVDALTTLTEALVLEPAYEFRPELYSESFRGLFYEAQKRALEERALLASRHTRDGIAHLRAGDYSAARDRFEAALANNSSHPNALYNLALTNLYDEREEEAQAGFQRLLALAGGEAEISPRMRSRALTNLGYLYSRQRQFQEAEEALAQAVEIDPENASTWLNLGNARRHLGDRERAAEAFRRAHELDPDSSETAGNLALAYLDAGDFARAAELLDSATSRHPGDANLRLFQGRAHLGLDGGGAAIAALTEAIRLDPGNGAGIAADAAIHLAIHYYDDQDYQKTLAEAEHALAWRPDLVNGHVYRGLARKGLGDLDGALESLEQARRLDPTRAQTHNNLGIVHYDLGRLEEAREAFERALQIDPGFANARNNLDALHQAGASRQASATTPAPPPPRAATPAPRSPPPPSRPPPPRRGTTRKSSIPDPPTSRPPRLGLRFSDVDYSALGLKGAMVESVESGGVASRAGIQKNDLILKVDGNEIADSSDFQSYVDQQGVGKSVVIDLLRANVPERVVLRLE